MKRSILIIHQPSTDPKLTSRISLIEVLFSPLKIANESNMYKYPREVESIEDALKL
jgi:hypothetical protein